MITIETIRDMQLVGVGSLAINYGWEPTTKTDKAILSRVWITFLKPSPATWKCLMTNVTDGFEIRVIGTRNKDHDGLDDCYVAVLDEVNKERERLGLDKITP